MIINTLNEKLDLHIKLQDIEKIHWICETKKTWGKTHPIIVKFAWYNDWNWVFRNKKKTKALRKQGMDILKQAKETYRFTHVWTNDGKILLKSDSKTKPQVYYS